jgi:hypothetical protein
MSIDYSFCELSSNKISNNEIGQMIQYNTDKEDPNSAYTALWRAVITQALMDAGSQSKKMQMKKEKARAISWLNGESQDFKDVCENASLDVDYVKAKAREAIKNECVWRVPTKNRSQR